MTDNVQDAARRKWNEDLGSLIQEHFRTAGGPSASIDNGILTQWLILAEAADGSTGDRFMRIVGSYGLTRWAARGLVEEARSDLNNDGLMEEFSSVACDCDDEDDE